MACFLAPMALAIITSASRKKFSESYGIDILNLLLWGGCVALALEHVAHLEIVPYPPFLTAGISEVLSEMLMVGVPMAICCTGVWATMIAVGRMIGIQRIRLSRLGILEE